MRDPRGLTQRTSTRVIAIVGALVLAAGVTVLALRWPGGAPASDSSVPTGSLPGQAAVVCARTAAPDGDDAGPGTSGQPYRTVQRLVASLQPGETGCLASGEYDGDVEITRGGQPGRPIVLTAAAAGSDRPTVRGRIVVDDSADHVVITGLTLNGRNPEKLPSPTINGDDVVLRGNEITNDNSGICVNLGHSTYGAAIGTVIEGNRIHHCGELPATNLEHGIYVSTARNTLIRNNLIYANADRGIQLYPDAQDSRIVNNVIDGNGTGVIFSGADGNVSNNNYVGENLITNSVRYDVDAFWSPSAGGVGTGNVVERNCLWSGGIAEVSDQPGFTEKDNIVANPQYVDRDRGVFRLADGSRCAGLGPDWGSS